MPNSSASNRHHIFGIEVSRGIAAILVILYHASRHIDAAYGAPLLRRTFQFGHAGVDFFFVISGFIILYVHYDDIGNPRQFARYVRRRLTRIFPIYWVALILTIVVQMLGHHGLPSNADLLWSALLLPSNKPMLLGIAWTLRFEMLFYVMFCLVILNRAGAALMACWFITSAFCAVSGTSIGFLSDQFQSAYVFDFIFGMAVAYIAKEQLIRSSYVFLAAGALLFACSGTLENLHLLNGYANYARLAYGIPSALVILGIVALPRTSASSAPSILRTVGAGSYSLYLFQFIFIGAAWQFLLRSKLATITTPWAQFLILSGAAIAGGVIMSKMVEQPLIRLCRFLISRAAPKQLSSQ